MNAQQVPFPILDQIMEKPKGIKHQRRSVDRTLTKVRRLHEELNTLLYNRPTERPSIRSPKDAFDIVQPFLQHLDHEELWVVVMDTKNRVMSLVALYKGSVNSSQVRVAEIFRQAVVNNAPAILLAHNHPSGDPAPSPDDVALTRVAFPIARQGRHSQTVISELNTAPMPSPTNASPRHRWSSRHSSGPERIATPFSVEDLALQPHLLLHAGFNRRFPNVPSSHTAGSPIPTATRRLRGKPSIYDVPPFFLN